MQYLRDSKFANGCVHSVQTYLLPRCESDRLCAKVCLNSDSSGACRIISLFATSTFRLMSGGNMSRVLFAHLKTLSVLYHALDVDDTITIDTLTLCTITNLTTIARREIKKQTLAPDPDCKIELTAANWVCAARSLTAKPKCEPLRTYPDSMISFFAVRTVWAPSSIHYAADYI